MPERGPYNKGRERREAIIRSTLNVFSELGSRKASMSAIAADVGISPGLLRYYFSTREDLLLAVISEWDKENAQRGLGLSHFADWLIAIGHNATIPGVIHLYTTCLVEATDPDHPGREFYRRRYATLTRKITAEILMQQRNGQAPPDMDPDRVARLLLAVSEGLQIRWLHEPDFSMFREFAYLLKELGLAVPEIDGGELDIEKRLRELSVG
jgi:AcrR family transcriptional regulator